MNGKTVSLLTDYFIREYNIDITREYEIVSVPARSLVCADRFDLMAKWIYIDAREKGLDMSYAIRVYKDNINSFSCGTFFEPGSENKDSFQKYLNDFDALIDEIKGNGFDANKSLIPVGDNDRIFDGSHRVATAAYYDKNVSIIRFPGKRPNYDYDYRYFRKYIMNDFNMGYMAIQYAHLIDNCFFACIWPVADRSKVEEAEELLKRLGAIVYSQDVYLTHEGMRNFMVQIYGTQSWVGSIEDKFEGVNAKVELCYNPKNPVRTYLIEVKDTDKVVPIKAKIRDIFGIDNHSIHISDTNQETIDMAEMLYNTNSVDFLNYAKPFEYDVVYRLLKDLLKEISDNSYKKERFVIDSSAVLEVCGLRKARDLDYLTDYRDEIITGECIDNHESQIQYHSVFVQDMLYNPENYFYYYGFKFLSIYRLKEMKSRRNEPKDQKDVELCESFIKRYVRTPIEYRRKTIDMIYNYQIERRDYGHGSLNYQDYKKRKVQEMRDNILIPVKRFKKLLWTICNFNSIENQRTRWVNIQRRKLQNKEASIISSNCNGGVLASDLGLRFNSPFVNLFIQAGDYIKILKDLTGYMSEELKFVKEVDPIYGEVEYPTAYLRDAKIYFMHYKTEEEAKNAWTRRKERINWDNLYIIFTDRSQCTEKDLNDFDRLPYSHKVVFTHVPHPELKSAFYIKGYEKDDKVPVLSAFEDENRPVKRIYDQFDFVGWLNDRRE